MAANADQLKKMLDAALRETGASLTKSSQELALYAAGCTARLAAARASGESGFDEAARLEVKNTRAYAADLAVDEVDAVDAKFWTLFHGALLLGAAV